MFWHTSGNMPNQSQFHIAAAWKQTVETWLVCKGLI
jgi:hypothetical protein